MFCANQFSLIITAASLCLQTCLKTEAMMTDASTMNRRTEQNLYQSWHRRLLSPPISHYFYLTSFSFTTDYAFTFADHFRFINYIYLLDWWPSVDYARWNYRGQWEDGGNNNLLDNWQLVRWCCNMMTWYDSLQCESKKLLSKVSRKFHPMVENL